jgi:HmuY protein
MKTNLIALSVVATGVLFASCKKDEVAAPVTVQTKTVSNLQADTIIGIGSTGQPYGSGKYTFYSLESNTIIANTDSATTKWDVGFRGTTIITNGGNGGPGAGGAFVYTGTFGDLSQISTDSTFRTDNAPTAYAIKTGSGNGWYSYNPTTNLVTPIPGRILVIRTASGKYAKIEIQNYYKGGVTPDATASDNEKLTKQRYYTFRYSYQSDGTKKF